MNIFGTYPDGPTPYSLNGASGWFSVPGGRNWSSITDKDGNIWVSPNPLSLDANGAKQGTYPIYLATMGYDGVLVFQDCNAARHLGLDSPPPDRLSQTN